VSKENGDRRGRQQRHRLPFEQYRIPLHGERQQLAQQPMSMTMQRNGNAFMVVGSSRSGDEGETELEAEVDEDEVAAGDPTTVGRMEAHANHNIWPADCITVRGTYRAVELDDTEAEDMVGDEAPMSARAPSAEASAPEAAAWPSVRRMARVWADRIMGSLGRCGCCDGSGALLGVRVESEVGDVDADVEDEAQVVSESMESRTDLRILASHGCLIRQMCRVWPCRTY
jgi:hypothetical protein